MIIDNNDNIVNNQIKDCQKTVDSDKVVNSIENNDTLLISEVIGKVILPYTSKEVSEILQNDNCEYKNENEVIENVFTRPFSDYRFQIISRYNETMKLAREREDYGLTDSISLAMEQRNACQPSSTPTPISSRASGPLPVPCFPWQKSASLCNNMRMWPTLRHST